MQADMDSLARSMGKPRMEPLVSSTKVEAIGRRNSFRYASIRPSASCRSGENGNSTRMPSFGNTSATAAATSALIGRRKVWRASQVWASGPFR